MSPDRLRLLIESVGFPSIGEAARFFRIEERMFRRMTTGQQDIPHAVVIGLEIMAAYGITPGDLAGWKFED
jgi:hypothetical protein